MRYRKLMMLALVVLWAACAGAGTYYCDLSLDYVDATGADHAGNEYAGVGGLQAAIRGTGNATALVAGDTLYLKQATGNLGRLVVIDCGVDVSGGGLGWALTDEVRNKDGAGDDWTGVICQLDVGADAQVILVELDAAYTSAVVADGDGIENTTQAESADPLDSHSCPGIQIDTNSGSDTTGHIKVIGVAADWSTGTGTSYCATLDGQSVATACIGADTVQHWWWENLILTSAGDGLTRTAGYLYWWVFDHVIFESMTGGGGFFYYHRHVIVRHSIFRNNTSYGAGGPSGAGTFLSCIFSGNGDYGVSSPQASAFIGCLFTGNADDNLYANSSLYSTLYGCTLDGSVGGSGIRALTARNYLGLFLCRLTNNNQYGFEQDDAASTGNIEDWNIFYNNGVAERLNIAAGANSRTAATAAEAGYTDQAGGDFTLTAAAIMAGTDAAAIALDWTAAPSNTGYYTAGIPREAGGGLMRNPPMTGGMR